MNADKIRAVRQRLTVEHENLLKALKRSQLAVEDIKSEKTEDEADLASMSHDRDVLYNLHEGSFARLQLIKKAIEAIDDGQYGKCVRCEEDINDRRLDAVPWAAMCIGCQEQTEAEHSPAGMKLGGLEAEAEL